MLFTYLCRIIYNTTGQSLVRVDSLDRLDSLTRLVKNILRLLIMFSLSLFFVLMIWAFFWVACFASDVCYNAQFIELP